MISIITVCHNSSELLPHYLSSFLAHNSEFALQDEIEFVFVENSGDLNTNIFSDELERRGFAAKTLHVPNRGFGAGCNAGAKVARGDIIVFANPDIRFTSPLTSLCQHFYGTKWGTIRQIDGAGSTYALDLLPECRNLFTELLRPFRFLHQFSFLYKYCYPVGSFLVLSRNLFFEAGCFDERFFLYYEEAELSRRIKGLVGPLTYCSGISVVHEGFGTQKVRDFTFQEEARGFLTYAFVTNQFNLVSKRLRTLNLLSVLSEASSVRATFLRDAIRCFSVNGF